MLRTAAVWEGRTDRRTYVQATAAAAAVTSPGAPAAATPSAAVAEHTCCNQSQTRERERLFKATSDERPMVDGLTVLQRGEMMRAEIEPVLFPAHSARFNVQRQAKKVQADLPQ